VGDAAAHIARDRHDLGAVHDEHAVDVYDLVAGQGDLFERRLEADGGVRPLPFGIGRREEGADVSGGDGSEQGVGDGVQQQIAVGVPGEALRVVDLKASDDQGATGFEG